MVSLYVTPEHYEIAEKNGISKRNLYQRVYVYDMPIEEAIVKPIKKRTTQWSQLKRIAEKNGIGRKTFYSRLDYGWDPMRAATDPVTPVGRNKQKKTS